MLHDPVIRSSELRTEPPPATGTVSGSSRRWLRSGSVIVEAAWIIARAAGCDPDEAMEEMSRQAHLQRIRMRVLATAVVRQHEVCGR